MNIFKESSPDWGYGGQVSSERMDRLDNESLNLVQTLVTEAGATQPPFVFDLGCGTGSHSIRMAAAGGKVFSVDCQDYSGVINASANEVGLKPSNPRFVLADVRALKHELLVSGIDWNIAYCQRMLHYLRYREAEHMLLWLAQRMVQGGALFLGISGRESELGTNYKHHDLPIFARFCELDISVQTKHRIRKAVCLYTLDEAIDLVKSVGLTVDQAWTSEFGNIKLVAYKG